MVNAEELHNTARIVRSCTDELAEALSYVSVNGIQSISRGAAHGLSHPYAVTGSCRTNIYSKHGMIWGILGSLEQAPWSPPSALDFRQGKVPMLY